MRRPSYTQTAAPTLTPVTLPEAKVACRVDHDDEDSYIKTLIEAATVYAQEYQWSQLVTSTWEQRVDRFPSGAIELHPNPVISITSVEYIDTSGVEQTLVANTDYVSDLYRKPGLVYPAFNTSWPTTRGFENDVTVTFVAGYGAPSAVPSHIKQAILMLVAHWYEHREATGCASGLVAFSTGALLNLTTFRTFT